MIPEDDRFPAEPVQPRRFRRRSAVAWVFLALVVLGAITALLIWVSHRLGSVAG